MPLILFALGGCLAALPLLGPLGTDLMQWRVTEPMLAHVAGNDVVRLVLAMPLALMAGLFWPARHRLAPLLAITAGAFGVVASLEAVVIPAYIRIAGNAEGFFVIAVALLLFGWLAVMSGWRELPAEPPVPPRAIRRILGIPAVTLGIIWLFVWTAQVAVVGVGGEPPQIFRDAPDAFWMERLLGLGVLLPLTLAGGMGLLRGEPGGVRIALAGAGVLTLLLAAELATMLLLDLFVPAGTNGALVVLAGVLTLVVSAGTFALYGWYRRGEPIAI